MLHYLRWCKQEVVDHFEELQDSPSYPQLIRRESFPNSCLEIESIGSPKIHNLPVPYKFHHPKPSRTRHSSMWNLEEGHI